MKNSFAEMLNFIYFHLESVVLIERTSKKRLPSAAFMIIILLLFQFSERVSSLF